MLVGDQTLFAVGGEKGLGTRLLAPFLRRGEAWGEATHNAAYVPGVRLHIMLHMYIAYN